MEFGPPTTPLPYYKCDDFPVPIVVRNTFINAVIERSPSLQRFVRERRASSCPLSSGSGGAGGSASRLLIQTPTSEGSASPQTAPARPHHHRDASGDPAQRLAAAVSAAEVKEAPVENRGGASSQRAAGQRVVCGAPVGLVIPKQPSRHRARQPGALPGNGIYGEAAGGAGGADVGGATCMPSTSPVPTEPRAKPRTPAAVSAGQRAGQEPSALVEAPGGFQRNKYSRSHWVEEDMPSPSIGSEGHYVGKCRPCVFVHKKGCSNGYDCLFCHICQPGEKQRRKRDRWEKMRDKWSSSRSVAERSHWEE